MVKTTTNGGGGEHVTGDWFSVPELRLRDHHFTVPLDYSLDNRTCPKISVFAREMYERWLSLDTNPLYVLMHESIYSQGAPSLWSAHKIRTENDNLFDAIKAVKEGRPVLFTGEMIFPWMFDEIPALRPFKEVAQLLAEKKDWPPLYDIATLNNNKVSVADAVFYEDVYVNFKLSMDTASQIAGIGYG